MKFLQIIRYININGKSKYLIKQDKNVICFFIIADNKHFFNHCFAKEAVISQKSYGNFPLTLAVSVRLPYVMVPYLSYGRKCTVTYGTLENPAPEMQNAILRFFVFAQQLCRSGKVTQETKTLTNIKSHS